MEIKKEQQNLQIYIIYKLINFVEKYLYRSRRNQTYWKV